MLTIHVPERVRNKCERITGPQPERFQSVFAGVNATRTSGTGPEPEREPEQVWTRPKAIYMLFVHRGPQSHCSKKPTEQISSHHPK